MEKIVEYPDLTIKSEKYYDELDITIRKDEVEFNAKVDSCGNIFKINKEKFLSMLK